MTPSRPDNEAIFHAARDIHDRDRRRDYVRQACGGDEIRIAHVEALLAAADAPDSLLDRPAASDPVPTIDQAATESPGTTIGPYKLLEQIGEGGMGTVWMAQQTEPVKRLVALKLIKAGMDSKQVIARFEAERQALAIMDHPNIAKVFDGGMSEVAASFRDANVSASLRDATSGRGATGLPYFVMELVKGVPITKYCDEHRLTPRQRLELFIPVCQAIQHAHQKGIIHRDLKPSNVLVAQYDGRPVPKVIDFGVAKAAGQPLTEQTLVTGFGHIVGTLEYMSPEQAEVNQLDIDTRSDIYSLGVLLYELLTGSPPFSRKDLEKAGMLEMLRVIREQEPSKPSTKLSSSNALPTLSANRGTEPAKLTKLVRGELDWIVMKALEKDRNRRYETANGFAQDVQRYLADEAVQACPPSVGYRFRKFARRNKGSLAVAALVLFFLVLFGTGVGWAARDRAARQAEAARQQAERQAKVAGQVESIFGEVDRLMKEQKWPEAMAAARRAEAAATGGEADTETTERVRQRLKDLEFIDRLERIRMERAAFVGHEFNAAGVDRAYAQTFRDYGEDVEELTVEASINRLKIHPALAIPLAAALDEWMNVRPDVAGRKRLIAVARGIDPEPLRDRLRSTYGRPLSEVQEELRQLPESIDVKVLHPVTIVTLARALSRVSRSDLAVRLLRDAQRFYPGDFWLNFELANALSDQKDREGAIRFYTAAVSVRPNSSAALSNLGTELRLQKRLDEAIACHMRAIEVEPTNAKAFHNLGNALREQKKLPQAIAAYQGAVELDPKYALAYTSLGQALQDQKKLPEAIAAYQMAIKLDPKFVNTYVSLGVALREERQLDDAIAACRKAIDLDPKFALAHYNLGNILREQKKLDAAIICYRKAIELDPECHWAHHNLGLVLYDQFRILGDPRKLDEAIAAFNKAIKLEPKNIYAHYCLGNALRAQKKLDEAIARYKTAVDLDPTFALAYYDLGIALRNQNKLDEAIVALRKAVELNPKSEQFRANLGNALNSLAWALATDPAPAQREPGRAVNLAQEAVQLFPKAPHWRNTLGVAQYRAGNWEKAISTLNGMPDPPPSFPEWATPFFLAMAHWQLGNKEEAIRWNDKAIDWMGKRKTNSDLMRRLRAECAELLKIGKK